MSEPSYPDPQLRDGVVVLRRWRVGDLRVLSQTWSDPDFGRFLTGASDVFTEEDAEGWFVEQESRRRSGSLALAVAHVDSDELLGSVSAQVNMHWLRAEIGYWLVPAAQGRGVMTTSVRLLCNWLFEGLNLGRIELTTNPANVPSQRVAERVGFVQEGVLRGYLLDHSTGVRRDSQIWSLLPGDLISG